jgi:hypothetical protein
MATMLTAFKSKNEIKKVIEASKEIKVIFFLHELQTSLHKILYTMKSEKLCWKQQLRKYM